MYNACGLLFLSFGFTMLKFISCYSSGALLESECQEMNINHRVPEQNTEAPFKIEPEYINVTDSELGTNITVTLSADPAHFRGFMLDARKSEKYKSAGWFNLTDPDNNVLICGDRAVAQRNNLRKTRVEVLWTPEETGEFFFRAAFVEEFDIIWPRKPILTSTAASTTEATSHSTQTSPTDTSQTVPPTSEAISAQKFPTTSPTIFTTTSNIDSHATDTSQTVPPTSEAISTQKFPTTSPTIFTTTSNIDSHATDTSQTVPPTSEAISTQKFPTTSPTIFTTTSNIDSHATDTSQTVPPTSEAISTQKFPTTSPTIFTTTSNIDSHATVGSTPPPQCTQYTRCALALLLFSRLCFLGGCSLLMIIRPVLKMATMIVSVIELASKIIAVIFILIKLIQYKCECECDSLQIAFAALTVTAMVSSILHIITVFLHCGPSHELRKCWLCALIMVDLMNTLNTTTAIFFGIWCFKELWLPVLMGVYVIWEFMLYLGSVCYEKMEKYQSRGKLRKNPNHILEKRVSPWSFMFSIFSVFNVMFTAALMTGVSLVKMENC